MHKIHIILYRPLQCPNETEIYVYYPTDDIDKMLGVVACLNCTTLDFFITEWFNIKVPIENCTEMSLLGINIGRRLLRHSSSLSITTISCTGLTLYIRHGYTPPPFKKKGKKRVNDKSFLKKSNFNIKCYFAGMLRLSINLTF